MEVGLALVEALRDAFPCEQRRPSAGDLHSRSVVGSGEPQERTSEFRNAVERPNRNPGFATGAMGGKAGTLEAGAP
jgi:hypothetical protein